jgi:succinate dehydrogenase/fumarate reductase flavoprotein subunit
VQAETVIETDVLVIGGGIAGCFAAMKARDKGVDVTLVDKATARLTVPSMRSMSLPGKVRR